MRYYVDGLGAPLLLRSDGRHDQKWQGGRWTSTRLVDQYLTGHNDGVDDLTEEQARALAPEAFAS